LAAACSNRSRWALVAVGEGSVVVPMVQTYLDEVRSDR
jgi:hypothetical protein